jgi:hypothetical protein
VEVIWLTFRKPIELFHIFQRRSVDRRFKAAYG